MDCKLSQLDSLDIALNLPLHLHVIEHGIRIGSTCRKQAKVRYLELLGKICKVQWILVINASEYVLTFLLACSKSAQESINTS